MDFFQARYMSSAQGRFTSPDPGPWLLLNPQSYNAYTYGLNNPLRYGDEDGETPQDRVIQANRLLAQNIPYAHNPNYISDPGAGLDCSGLAANAFHADPDNTVALPRTAVGQAGAFESQGEFSTDASQARPGDAIYFANSSGTIVHTGIVVDIRDGKIYFVHAPRPGKKVNKAYIPINTGRFGSQRFAGVGRPIEHPRSGRPQKATAAPGMVDRFVMWWNSWSLSGPSPSQAKPYPELKQKKKKGRKLIPRGNGTYNEVDSEE